MNSFDVHVVCIKLLSLGMKTVYLTFSNLEKSEAQ